MAFSSALVMSGCGETSASNSLQHLKQRRTHVAEGSIEASPGDECIKFSGVGKFYLTFIGAEAAL